MKTRLSIAALLVVSASSALADPPVYRITIIDPLGADKSAMAYGINDQGQVVGATYTSTNPSVTKSRAFTWTAGSLSLMGGGLAQSQGLDINEAGFASVQATGVGAYRYNSATNTLTPLEGSGALARGISGAGMLAGTFGASDHKLPVFWGGGVTTMSLMNTQSGNPQGYVQGVNANGQVIGRDDFTQNPNNAFEVTRDSWVWTNGSYINLTRPSGDNSEAFALNNVGKAAGIVTDASGEYQTALWDFSSGTASATLITDIAGKFIPSGMNDDGMIVGNKFFQRFATNFTGDDAFLYADGVSYDLNSLRDLTDPTSAGFTIRGAMDINNQGQIVGLGIDANGRKVGYVATLVTPVPEPASLLALGGLVGLVLRKRRRNG